MKLLILYHPKSEHSTTVEDYALECRKKTSQSVEIISLETNEGATLASVYDIVDYPAILVVREGGQIMKFWQGKDLPLIEEVTGYLNT